MLRVEWFTRLSDIEALQTEWYELEAAITHRTVYSSFDWVIPWYRHYGPTFGVPLVGTARKGAQLVGLAPLISWRGTLGRVPVRRIDLAGHNFETAQVLAVDGGHDILTALSESILQAVPFDVMSLNSLAVDSSMLQILKNIAERCRLRVEHTDSQYAVVDLRNGYQAYADSMSRNFRRNVKRHADKMLTAGALQLDRIDPSQQNGPTADAMQRVFSIDDASWKAKTAGPMPDYARRFYEEVAARFSKRSMLNLSILSLDQTDAAYLFALVERGVFYDVMISYRKTLEALSPGTYLMHSTLKTLPDHGIHAVVSYGDHEYKQRWASRLVSQRRLFIFSNGFAGHLGRMLKFVLPGTIARARKYFS
jgi:CelD/BcsL family acetyltransferase involved in cellulose biosynthesis